MITSSQHFPSAFQRKHHIFLKQVKISRKTLFSASEITKNFTLCNDFLFQLLSRTICLAFLKKSYLTTCGRRMTFWTFITSFDWTDRASLIVRARARTLASFASYIAYSLGLARSHYCARPMRFGLKASTEKAWKDRGKSFKNANSRKKSEAPGYATTQAVMSSTPEVPEVFFSRVDRRAPRDVRRVYHGHEIFRARILTARHLRE